MSETQPIKPVVSAVVAPKTTVTAPKTNLRLTRVQGWLGRKTLGLFYGVETKYWSLSTWEHTIRTYGAAKPDYVVVKGGQGGQIEGTAFGPVRQACIDAQIGCAPYVWPTPDTWQADVVLAGNLAKIAGGVILDCEEAWLNHNAELTDLLTGLRARVGVGPIIIVTGYGDPETAVPGWDFAALKPADAYMPQWYLAAWGPALVARHGGAIGTINWADGQCSAEFVKAGLTEDFPIVPLFDHTDLTDLDHLVHYGERWQASVALWEGTTYNLSEREALLTSAHEPLES